MAKARANPLGFPVGPNQTLVKVGNGFAVHILNRSTGLPLCRSGAARAYGKQPVVSAPGGFCSCYRCAKLAKMNVSSGRSPELGP